MWNKIQELSEKKLTEQKDIGKFSSESSKQNIEENSDKLHNFSIVNAFFELGSQFGSKFEWEKSKARKPQKGNFAETMSKVNISLKPQITA